MLWSLLEDIYINIGYRNDYPPEKAAAALQSVWAKVGEEGKKKECYECKAFAVDLHTAFTINTLTDSPQVHPVKINELNTSIATGPLYVHTEFEAI